MQTMRYLPDTALVIAIGKIVISMLSAFAIVYFRFPFRVTAFWLIFVTLMLPVEVRILPTYKVMVDLGLIDTYAGLILPLVASATATLLFRQFFMTIPGELVVKQGRLTPAEFTRMRQAARSVENILAEVDFLRPMVSISGVRIAQVTSSPLSSTSLVRPSSTEAGLSSMSAAFARSASASPSEIGVPVCSASSVTTR